MELDHVRTSRVDAWLSTFAVAVRSRDYDGARKLFNDDVESFGTVATHVEGLDRLETEQWGNVWPQTEDFDFVPESKQIIFMREYVVVLARWTSRDMNAEDEQSLRSGRCTIVLREVGAEGDHMQACHTHFSIDPGSIV